MRIGHGFDAHRLVDNRQLVLGGVQIDHPQGLEAHSDGDVVIHALCDALLGAAGLADIGHQFPDTDASLKGIDSRDLLRQVSTMLNKQGLAVGNADLTVVAQAPRLAPFIIDMRNTLASDLAITPEQLNIKATTTEGLGFTGRRDGIAAFAVCLLLSL